MNRVHDSALFLVCLLTLFDASANATQEALLLGGQPAPGQIVGTWGDNSSATISRDGVLRVKLDRGLHPAGAFLSLGRSFDLSHGNQPLYLAMDVRGAKGGESFSLVLRDGSESDGKDGYQAEANLPRGFHVTTQWQRLVMPLSDFPGKGENWRLPAPAGSQGPLRRKVDWSAINMLGIDRWAGAMTLEFRNIVATTNPESATSRLLAPPQLPQTVDLAHGKPLLLTASFSGPTRWQCRITQTAASKQFEGVSSSVDVEWDGDADQGEFKAGPCIMELKHGPGLALVASNLFDLVFPHSPRVQVAQTGYAPDDLKFGAVTGPRNPSAFRVIDAKTGEVVLRGTTATPVEVALAGEWAASLDFSSVHKPGTYYVEVEGTGRSYAFPVRQHIYHDLLQSGMKSYYYQRCGLDLISQYAGRYGRKACHTNDAWVYAGSTNDLIIRGPHRPADGGWHDAGDYGKKIVPASDALGYLLMACELFPEKVRSLRLDIPGDPGLPDMLCEIKYELDWMLTMQEADGGVQALITSQDFFLNGMPDQDPQPRFFTGVSSCATGDFAAVLAQAARIFRAWDKNFADRCLAASRRAWDFLGRHPEIVPRGGYHDPAGIHGTGTYDDSDDRDERFRAACELFVTTGETPFNDYVREHAATWSGQHFEPPGYMNAQGFGIFSYAISAKGDPSQANAFRETILDYARKATQAIEQSPYAMALDLNPTWWNNSTALESSAALAVASRLSGNTEFANAALRQFQSVLGCNPTDRCYLTGFGCRQVMDPWQPACVYDGIAEPVPGFVLPGPNRVAWDLPMQRYQEIHHLPPLKNYLDDHRAPSVNEVCLVFNGPFVLVAALLADE